MKKASEDYSKFDELSPFELKDELIAMAQSDSQRMMLNAGRGNPNFLATVPRRAFLRLGDFALLESERSYVYLNSGIGGMPELNGIDQRFEMYASHHHDEEGVSFLRNAIAFVKDRLGQDEKSFIYEMTTAFLGCVYPVPPRMLPLSEQIVKAYLAQEMFGKHPRKGDFSVFATEGGTAAMTYIFQTLAFNGLIGKGDKIALGTPIFSPYLEIPVLEEYGLEVVDIRMDEEDDWQFPDSELQKLEDPDVKIFFVVNPSNPPSVKLSDENLQKIADIVNTKRNDLLIVTDDVYGTFAQEFVSLFAVCPRNTLCVYSFSKYFGATGWRLGTIALHDDNVLDEALAALPASAKKKQAARYSSLTNQSEKLRFIDRLVADSRAVALNHTAGLSTPQQFQMVLLALNGLMDNRNHYKDAAQHMIHHRYETLCLYVGIPPEIGPNEVNYYYLVDLQKMGGQLYGAKFANWMENGDHGTEFLFRLAKESGVVLLPGKGFEVVDASVRVSLANLTDAEYQAIGQCTRKVLDELYEEFRNE